MKSCTQCGHTLQDDHVFCNKCGHKWQDPEVARLAEQEKINEKLRNRKHAIIAFYVASVFIILFIISLYTPPFPVSTGDRAILKISNFFCARAISSAAPHLDPLFLYTQLYTH